MIPSTPFSRRIEKIAALAFIGWQLYRVWQEYDWWIAMVVIVANVVIGYVLFKLLIWWAGRKIRKGEGA